MEIIDTKGNVLDIPKEYTLEFEFTNPVIEEEIGSQTAPATLPYTPYNLKCLDYPNRIDRKKKYSIKRNVTLKEGVFYKEATQAVLKANQTDRIVSSFYFDEAVLYEKIQGLKLTTLNYTQDSRLPASTNANLTTCLNVVLNVAKQSSESDFHVFPVLCEMPEFYHTIMELCQNPEIINMTVHASNVLSSIRDWSSRQDTIDDVVITYPRGYGISVYLKVSYILETIAKNTGYEIGNNIFSTNTELSRLVILNNVADALVKGWIDYQQLIPDISVADFILNLRKKFGIVIIVDEQRKLMHIETINDILQLAPDFDLTPFVTSEPTIEWSEPSQIKLSAGTSLPFNASEETYEDFFSVHGPVDDVPSNANNIVCDKLYYDRLTNSYVTYAWFTNSLGARAKKNNRMHGANFAYFSKDNLEYKEMIADDEQVTLLSFTELYDNDKFEGYILPFVGSRKNANTSLYVNREEQKEEEVNMPLMYAFSAPARTASGTARLTMGTPYDTNSWGNLTLNYYGDKGLFNTFFKNYDNFLRHSNQPMTCQLHLPLSKLQMLKLHTPKLLFNQPVLIERIKCRLGNGKCEITEAVFRTLRSYED